MGQLPAATYQNKSSIDLSRVRQQLKLKQLEARNYLVTSFPKAHKF